MKSAAEKPYDPDFWKKAGVVTVRRASNRSTHHKGAWAELIACTWLMERGHQVFRNVCPSGEIDIIAVKDGGVLLIDVKLSRGGQTGPRMLTFDQTRHRVIPLYVTPEGVCAFDQAELRSIYALAKARFQRRKND